VAFGDINLSTDRVTSAFEVQFKPGMGGWPTHRFFNKATGYGGKPYVQKTEERICDELGKEEAMMAYVSEVSGAYLCDPRSAERCTAQEAEYASAWRNKPSADVAAELAKFSAELDKEPTGETKVWLDRQRSVLAQLASAATKDEL
jgi:hypothetical protein